MRRRRTGPFLTEHGRIALASVLTVACALAFAVASETSGPRAADSHPAGASQ